jgi:hypothetical protein
VIFPALRHCFIALGLRRRAMERTGEKVDETVRTIKEWR